LPSGYTFNGFTVSTGTYIPATGVWTIGNLINGASETLQITATVNPTGTYLNTAEVTASDLPDPNSTPANGDTTENDYAEATTAPIQQSADLSLTKTVSNATPVVGSEVTFSVNVTNNGPQDTSGVSVTDQLPSGYTYVSYTATAGTYDTATGVWTVGSLVNTATQTLQITATVNPTGTYLNTAEVTASDLPDPNSTPANGDTTENDYAEATTAPIQQSSDLSLTKTVSNATPLVGSEVTFEIVVANNGPQDNTGVQVTDLLPSGYTFNGFTVSTGTYIPATGVWTVGNLMNGASETLQITATVNATGTYLNTAEVTASDLPDPDSTPNNSVVLEDDYATAVTIPIQQSSDLSLAKTVSNATPLVGSEVTFEIVVANNGPQDNTGVQVTDLLPSGYTFNGFTVSTGTYIPATGVWTIGNLINGASETLQITATVNPTGTYLNTAEVTASDLPDPDSTPNNSVVLEDDYATAVTIPIQQSSDLSLTKTVSNATPLVGSEVTFEIIVANNGPQDNTGVQVTDLLPSGYTFNGFTVSTGTYIPATGVWTIGNLINGASETLQITAKVNPTGTYLNTAEVTASDLPDPDSTPNNSVVLEDDYATAATTPIMQAANLSLTKTVNNTTPLVGSVVTFEIIVTNSGPQNTAAVRVNDVLPNGFTYNSFTATKGTYNASTGVWNIGSLINGDSQTLQITATVNSTGNYTNIAEVTGSSLPDPNSTPNNGITTEDDYASVTVTPVQALADLSLVKTVVGGNLNPVFGSTITFEITVQNSGPQAASGVSVIDLLPNGFEYNVYSSTTGQYSDITGIWSIGTIASGESESLLISANVNNTGNYQNTAEVYSSAVADPDSAPNNGIATEDDISSVTITPVSAIADLSIEKKVVNDILTPAVGSQITFSVIVTNSGPGIATGVTVKDILPAGYEYNFFNSTSGSYNPVSGIWNPNVILPGNSHTLLLNVYVKNPTGITDEYLNSAEIMTSDQLDSDSTPGNGISTEDDYDSIAVTPVIVTADLSIKKKTLSGNTTFDVGGNIIFELTVTNDGPDDATGVQVKDLLPAGFRYLTYTSTIGIYNYVTGIWNVGSINSGTSQTLQLYYQVNAPSGSSGEYTNITEITASNLPDPDSTPNNGVISEDDYDSITINVNVADLSLDKTVSNKNANVDETVTFTLYIGNDGPATATGVAIEDNIPLGYRNISNITNGGIFSLNTIRWVNLTIPVGGLSLTYNATAVNPYSLESSDYINIAQVTASNQFDPDSTPNNDNGDQSEDDEDSEFINIPSTDIAITKDVDKTDVPMGSEVVFSITAENIGNLTATNVEVQDILPKGYSLNSYTTSSGVYNSATGIWTIPVINAGSAQILTINAKVIDFNDYLNKAHLVKLDQIDTNSSNNEDDATVSPNCLKIYNEFSPNDDGQNDTFYIDCITQYPDNELSVFNRWGDLVYFRKGYDNSWDGKAEGSAKTLPEGTYFYILDLGNGSPKTSGWLYLR
ncbi:gliding motility-associated C-terminal domain-containing protein, partial [Flavobacterium fluviatile]|uniref:T9SS type B sorting domain-containing protein n=1 Tax=Flavobacterium fluviatile TaxID=1862387 RepID=UPI0013D64D55